MNGKMKFNAGKCKVMHVGNRNRIESSYSVGQDSRSKVLDIIDEEKDLGICFDTELKFSRHISQAVAKSNQMLGLIKRSFVYKDIQAMKLLYTALVRPHLEYGNVVWHPTYKKDIDLVESVQRRATRMVPGLAKLSYEERLQAMDLPSLAYRRLRGDAIEVYKYLNGVYKVESSSMLPLVDPTSSQTRGHCLKIQKRHCRTRMRANFFSFRIVNMWNSLPADVVLSPTLSCFKGRIDRLWRSLQYSVF